MTVSTLLQAFAFVWGAIWGSFLNVVIYRLPRDLSLVRPGSRCGDCQTPIRWYDNVPVLSYLLLRGRCRACGGAFSPRYMLVEAACGVLGLATFQAAFAEVDPGVHSTLWIGLGAWVWLQIFCYALVAVAFIDLEHTYIPDAISLPALAIGLLGAALLPGVDGMARLWGALAGAGFLLLVIGVGWLIFRREAMGLGDVKLLAVIGAFLGWLQLPYVLLIAALQALLATGLALGWARLRGAEGGGGLVMTTTELDERFDEADRYPDDQKERLAVPFGPFLALGALEALLFGSDLFWRLAEGLAALIMER